MGYPTYEQLALCAIEAITREKPGKDLTALNDAMVRRDYPMVFKEAKDILGGQSLLALLQSKLIPLRSARIYELIVRWPVPVFLTTNYDDEIQNHLAKIEEPYIVYSNSEDHLGYLSRSLKGAIFKLHGDLRSESGLILDSTQYKEIQTSEKWNYWRTKLTSVFQMNPVVIIGHSLNDVNIRHVLETARKGAGVLQPVCWISPDIKIDQSQEFLEKYRIRVISYNNQEGEHRNLLRLVENINDFIPPRTSIPIKRQIAKLSRSPLGPNAAAPGFFVFNKLILREDFEQKRIDVLIAVLLSTLPKLISLEKFTLKEVLEMAGWPKELDLELDSAKRLIEQAIEQEILEALDPDKFRIGKNAESLASENRKTFEHTRELFKKSLILRIRRDFPSITDSEASAMADDIEASLTGYFREGGLSLVSTLFSGSGKQLSVPTSIIKFITEASARYNDLLRRQAFCKVSVDAFVHAEEVERDYLGRIAQGFFGFHSLGVFGGAAIERLKHARETVWLIDSDAQIPALALGSPNNDTFKTCFSRLNAPGIRFFTTEKLFDETREHLWFAHNLIHQKGPRSPLVVAAATGQPPFRKSNLFLEGFINWQSAGNPCDWNSYLFEIFENRYPGPKDVESGLKKLGIEVVAFQNWPGFSNFDYNQLNETHEKIKAKYESTTTRDLDPMSDPHKKALPEAEALIIINKEREGNYYILSDKGQKSPAWFISHTSLLNLIGPEGRVTWQPEAFLRFTSTLALGTDEQTANQAFEAILWGIARSGLSLLDERTIQDVCGGSIDQEKLDMVELRQMYRETISQKYGESLDDVLKRVSPAERPTATVQLLNEILQTQMERLQQAEALEAEATKRANLAEKKLRELEKFRKKMEKKKERGRHKAKKQKALANKRKKK